MINGLVVLLLRASSPSRTVSYLRRQMHEGALSFFFLLLPLVAAVGIYLWLQEYSWLSISAISAATAFGFGFIISSQLYIYKAPPPSDMAPPMAPPPEVLGAPDNMIQVCTPQISDGKITIQCSYKTVGQYPEIVNGCIKVGEIGSCVDKKRIISALDNATYAFNKIDQMSRGDPETLALVLDTSGLADFNQEFKGLTGTIFTGITPISLKMEAELVGPAFTIEPEGRQRREISILNPTRWEWEVTPDREGQHPLEVSLYVVLTKDGKKISEDKPLADRQIINVTVSRLDSLIYFAQKIDPLRAFIFALVTGLAGLLAWFGIKSGKDVSGQKPVDDKPQKIELTIKDDCDQSEGKKKE